MADRNAGARLAIILWFVAATLAWAVVAIRYVRIQEIAWTWVAIGLFLIAMGFSVLKRSRAAAATAPHDDAGTK